MSALQRLGIDPLKLRQRPWLHLDAEPWVRQRAQLANRPSEAFRYCQYDMRPGPERLPRSATATVEAAAFVAAVTGDTSDIDWLRTHLDMLLPSRGMAPLSTERGQYLAACAWSLDLLSETLDEQSYQALGRTLADQCGRAAELLTDGTPRGWHEPAHAATLAGVQLAAMSLLPVESAAAGWLEQTEPLLGQLLDDVAADGWWPTGLEDWNALLPLLTRVADAWQRLAGRDLFDHGVYREAWRVALHGVAPTGCDLLDLDHTGREDLPRRRAELAERPGAQYRWRSEPCRWALMRLAQRFDEPGFRAAVSRWRAAELGRGTPFDVIFDQGAEGRRVSTGRPYHTFAAHGLAVWRSNWDAAAESVALATGPARGGPDCDANHLLLWAGGEALAVDTGTLTAPTSEFHNTILVDGRGQLPADERDDDGARLASAWLSELGGCLVGQAGGCYPAECAVIDFDRHVGFAPGYTIVWDVLATRRPARFDWLLHSAGQIALDGGTHARLLMRNAALHVAALRPDRTTLTVEEARPKPDVDPTALRLRLRTSTPVTRTQFLVVMAPCVAGGAKPPQPSLMTDDATVGTRLLWPDGDVEDVLFPTHDRGIALPHLISDAAYLALRRHADGEWQQVIARRLMRLLVSGGEVITATQPVDLALSVRGNEVAGEVETPTGATVAVRCPFVPRGVVVGSSSGRARVDREARLAIVRLTAGRHQIWISGR